MPREPPRVENIVHWWIRLAFVQQMFKAAYKVYAACDDGLGGRIDHGVIGDDFLLG